MTQNRAGHAGPIELPAAASVASLAALGYNDAEPGQVVWVEDLRAPFVCSADVTQPPVAGQIVRSTDGTRTWRRLPGATVGSGYWNQRTDWHIDPVAGSFDGDGSAASPIDSWRELQSRLNGLPLLPGTTITLHGDLAEVIDASRLIPPPGGLTIDGDPGAATVLTGTVASYTAESLVAPGESPRLTSAAVADWTPWEGYRIRFTTGPAAGSYSSVARADPAGAGLNVARIPKPSVPGWPVSTPVTPAAGNTFVLEQLVTILGYVPPWVSADTPTILRGVAFPELTGTTIESSTNVVLWGCTSGDLYCNVTRLEAVGCRFCSVAGFTTSLNAQTCGLQSCTIHWSLLSLLFAYCDHCVWQEGVYMTAGHITLHHSGAFDTPGFDGLTVFGGATANLFGVLYGSGNDRYGVSCAQGFAGVTYDTKPVITGTLGNAEIAGVGYAWAAIPATAVNLSGIVTP